MLNEANTWTLPIDEDGVLTLPDELWNLLDWKEGDQIEFLGQDDGSFLLVKVDETESTEGEADPQDDG